MTYRVVLLGGSNLKDMRNDRMLTERYAKLACNINRRIFNDARTKFTIKLFYSRALYDKEMHRKTPNWEHCATDKNRVAIFAPSVYEKATSQKFGIYKATLIHEISHIFYMQTVGTYTPRWLLEGLAMNIEGRNYRKEFGWRGDPRVDHLYFAKRGKTGKDIIEFYRSSYLFVRMIINRIGWKGLSKLLLKYSAHPVKGNYERLFDNLLRYMSKT